MLRLYFGTTAATATTVLLLGMALFVGLAHRNRTQIEHWGRLALLLALWGLLVCCTAAMREGGYYYSVRYLAEGVGEPGIFAAAGLHAIAGGLLALAAVGSAVAAIFFKSQNVREILFFVMSGSLGAKILLMELSRIVLHFSAR